MKAIRYISGLVAGCMLFTYCSEEIDSPDIKGNITEGIPVRAVLSYDASKASVFTRATAEEENAVNDLYVLIFNAANGSFETSAYFTNDQLGDMGRNNIVLNTTTGTKKLYAVANTGSNSFSTNESTLKDKIDAFLAEKPGLAEWQKFSMTMTAEQVTWDGAHGTFTMSGYFVSDAAAAGLEGDILPGDGSCTIDTDGTVTVAGKIQLVRVVSQITFNVSDADNSKGEFTPTSWEVHNVPKSVYMNRQANEEAPENTSYFSRTGGTPDQGSFNFYMLENRQTAGTYVGTPLGKDHMNWREAYTSTGETKTYTNAPVKGTYVVLRGTYKGKAENPFNHGSNDNAEANVTYYIHLGYADKLPNDFSIPRNAKYTYNVTVAGVDDIIVEVVDENDPSNPSDGDVTFYDAEIIEVDAHYDRREIILNCDVSSFDCGIQTAKTGFEYKDLTDDLAENEKDIDWVYFMLKSKADGLNGRIVFPAGGTKTEGLMDIEELTEYVISATSTGDQTFYAYIAENYYDDLPYSKFVNNEKGIGNAKSRRMVISRIRMDRENSSVSSAGIIIQQKPITTIFNLENSTVSNGNPWGMEWENENLARNPGNTWSSRAQAGVPRFENNLQSNANNGYANTVAAIGSGGISVTNPDIDWANYPNANNAKPYAACMSRNRDENGNGMIDRDEIKWYLPASNQMQYLWIGMDAIPEDATLYPKDFRDADQWKFYHYATSDGQVFWAEEGCAIGKMGMSSAGKWHIRCTRNLGKGNDNDNAPLSIGTRSDDEDDVIVEVGDLLPDGVFRQGLASGKLSIHNEYDEHNKIYKKIRIKKSTLLGNNNREWKGTFKQAADRVYKSSTEDPCAQQYGRGWRSPNQREMILITAVGGFYDEMHTVTYFSFWDYDKNEAKAHNPSGEGEKNTRIGFSYTSQNLHLITPGSTDGNARAIRCVKDDI